MSVRFTFKSLKAVPRFFAYRNDVDIYTEDKVSDKEFYRTLFQRLLGDKVKINDVTPLGSKKNVLNTFDSQDSKSSRKKYFIVDGDLDIILNTNRKSQKNLIVLDSYCIENYLIDECGAIELIYYSCGTDDKDSISKRLNFEKWLGYNKSSLVRLFLYFSVLRVLGGGPKIRNAGEFLKQNKKETILDCDAIAIYCQEIKAECLQILSDKGFDDHQAEFEKIFQKLSTRWDDSNKTLLTIVSGKDYLLPLLQFRMNFCINKGKGLVPKESLKLFLANNADLKRLDFLKKAIA